MLECLLGAAADSVNSFERHDQELQKELHLLLVLDDEIDVPVFEVKCDALPGEERNDATLVAVELPVMLRVLLDLVVVHANQVLAVDPKP